MGRPHPLVLGGEVINNDWKKADHPNSVSFPVSSDPPYRFYPSASEGFPKKLLIWERANSSTMWEVRRGGT